MNTADRIAALKALTEDLQVVAELEVEHAEAKAAYAKCICPEHKETFRLVGQALALARDATRNSPVRDVEPGGMTIIPPPVGKT